MQTNDMQLARVFTTKAEGGTQDNTPTELGGKRQDNFYLTVIAEAGDNLGDLNAAYTLYIRASSTSGGSTTFTRQVLKETVTAGQNGWKDAGDNDGYVKTSNLRMKSADFPIGDSYTFIVTLLAGNGVVSKAESNDFVSF
ncbi:hypothetical protein AB0K48_16900 [Nonomuraea sp. NPDC055795]